MVYVIMYGICNNIIKVMLSLYFISNQTTDYWYFQVKYVIYF